MLSFTFFSHFNALPEVDTNCSIFKHFPTALENSKTTARGNFFETFAETKLKHQKTRANPR